MRGPIFLAINLTSMLCITSTATGTDPSGAVGFESINFVNPDVGPIDLNRLSTDFSSDVSTGVTFINDQTASLSNCLVSFAESTEQLQRRDVTSSGSSCSSDSHDEPLRQDENAISPSLSISLAQKQALRGTGALELDGDEGVVDGGMPMEGAGESVPAELSPGSVQPHTGVEEYPENPNQNIPSSNPAENPAENNIRKFQYDDYDADNTPCRGKKFSLRPVPICDSGEFEDIIRWAADFELTRVSVPGRGTYIHVD